MALSGVQYELAAGDYVATIAEVGASLRRYTVGGVDVTVPFGEDVLPPKCDGAVLVPWPNRLRNGRYRFAGVPYQLALTEPAQGNAIHGLARWVRWTALQVQSSSVRLGVDIVPQTGWVFEVHVEVTYTLRSDSGLSVTIEAVNTGSAPAPFGAGFHPYLSLHGHCLADTAVLIPAARRLLVDAVQIPVGTQSVQGTEHDLRVGRVLDRTRFDDGFTELRTAAGRGVAEVRTPSGGAQVWFDSAFGYLQVFTVEELMPGLAAVAVEPMTCAADAFNSGDGLMVLQPGQPWTATWGITPLP